MIQKAKEAIAALLNPKKWVVGLLSEKAIGTILRHGLNSLGAFLITVAGVSPEIVEQFIAVNYAVSLAVAIQIVAAFASRFPTPK